MRRQHVFERAEILFQLLDQLALLRAPLIETTAPKLPFFVAQIPELIGLGDDFLPIDVIQLERAAFDFLLDVAPQNGLNTAQFRGEKPELELVVQILCNDLGIVLQFEYHGVSVLDDRDLIVSLFGEFPNQRSFSGGDIDDLESSSGEFKDLPLNDTEWAPRKLN